MEIRQRKDNDYTVGRTALLEKRDMALLIEVEDTLYNMDQVFEQLAGYGHANGEFFKLDNVFDVIQNNSHECFSGKSEKEMKLFFEILQSREMTPEERAEILMNGTICK